MSDNDNQEVTMSKRTKPNPDTCRCRGKGCLSWRKIGRAKVRLFKEKNA